MGRVLVKSCSELTSSGIASIRNDSIFDYEGFNVKKYSHECTAKFGVPTRPDWIIQYYGEHVSTFILRIPIILSSYICI